MDSVTPGGHALRARCLLHPLLSVSELLPHCDLSAVGTSEPKEVSILPGQSL